MATALSRLRRSLVLVGMMGSGKTAVGRVLAQRLGAPFRDSDTAIEEAAHATIPEIFARDGEAFFRDRESEIIGRLLSDGPVVLSTGGGAFQFERNRQAIARAGVSMWLDADVDTLWERVRHRDTRPLLRTGDPRRTLADLHATRGPTYALADIRVPSELGLSVEQTAMRAMALAGAVPGLLEDA